MGLQELRAERETLIKANAAILGAYPDDQQLSEDHATTWDANQEKIGSLDAEILSTEKSNDRRAKQVQQTKSLTALSARKAEATVPGTAQVSVVPDKQLDAQGGFRNLNEFFLSVKDAGQYGRIDERLTALSVATQQLAAGSDEQGTYSDAYGGFFIPDALAPGMLQIDPSMDPMGGLTTRVPMSVPSITFNARVDSSHSTSVSGGFRVYRRGETGTTTTSRQESKQITLTAHALDGIAYATKEVLAFSPISFAALMSAGFSDEFQSKLIDERLNGTGVGEYAGIMGSGALISVAKESGQPADTIVYENIIKMRARMWGYGNAVWLANEDTIPQLMTMNQAIGTGGSTVWQPSAREDHPDMLLGRPLIFTEYAQTIGDKGDIVCGNWSQYLEGQIGGIDTETSIHVRFVEHETAFRFSMMNGGLPWWTAALTPKNGSTLSPFVTLNART